MRYLNLAFVASADDFPDMAAASDVVFAIRCAAQPQTHAKVELVRLRRAARLEDYSPLVTPRIFLPEFFDGLCWPLFGRPDEDVGNIQLEVFRRRKRQQSIIPDAENADFLV